MESVYCAVSIESLYNADTIRLLRVNTLYDVQNVAMCLINQHAMKIRGGSVGAAPLILYVVLYRQDLL